MPNSWLAAVTLRHNLKMFDQLLDEPVAFRGIIWDCYFEGWSHGMKVNLLKEYPLYVGKEGVSKL